MNSKYASTKAEIQSKFEQLRGILDGPQFQETKKFLEDKYKAAVPIAMNRLTDSTTPGAPQKDLEDKAGDLDQHQPKTLDHQRKHPETTN